VMAPRAFSSSLVDYSIVVPAYNAATAIGQTLAALAIQSACSERYEVIVVDDGSTDATADVVREQSALASSAPPGFGPIRLVAQEHAGAAAARNTGARYARGNVLLFLDADCCPAPDWAEQMVVPLDEPSIAGVSGQVCTHQRGLVARFIQFEYDERHERVARRSDVDFVTSATAAYRRDAFERVGGFDTDMLGAEDVELSFRLVEAGYRLAFTPHAVVYHRHPESWRTYVRRKFWYGYWRSTVYARHPSKVAGDSRTPQTQKLQIALAPLIAASALAALVWPPAALGTGAAFAVFGAVSARSVLQAWRRDPGLGILAPAMLLSSAAAAAAGLAAGLLRGSSRPLRPQPAPSLPTHEM
jgi:cellulose synthase/poly-beta-1,6-N-acetylglucosamine synthase-like glycosyltransferase